VATNAVLAPHWGVNIAFPNPLAGFERPLRGGGKKGEIMKGEK